MRKWMVAGLIALGVVSLGAPSSGADEPKPSAPPAAEGAPPKDPSALPATGNPITPAAKRPTGTVKLSPTLSIDHEARRLVLESTVVFREGPLELFLCPVKSKEHESILAAKVEPKLFQLALVMLGAKPGRPASFDPFQLPTGQEVRVLLDYQDGDTRKRVDAREWIHDAETKAAPAAPFVFAGSGFRKLPGQERATFLGDDGDLICVSNFPGAVLDLQLESSTKNSGLRFTAWTERIPPQGTAVTIYVEPVFKE